MSDTKQDLSQWFFMRWASKLKQYSHWIFPKNEHNFDGAIGEVRRLVLSRKSWFDSIASSWSQKSFWVHAATALSVFVFSPILFSLAQISFLTSISFIALAVLVHVGLLAHERNRILNAETSIQDSINLTELLNQKEQVVNELTDTLNRMAQRLEVPVQQIEQQTAVISNTCGRIDEECTTLSETLTSLTQRSEDLVEMGGKSLSDCHEVSTSLNDLGQAIKDTTDRAKGIDDTMIRFNETVTGLETHYKERGIALSRLSLFVNELTTKKNPEPSSISRADLDDINAQLDRMDVIVEDNDWLLQRTVVTSIG